MLWRESVGSVDDGYKYLNRNKQQNTCKYFNYHT